MKRLLLLLPLALALAPVLLAPTASATSPDQRGWWSAFGPSPDVPADGLLIQGGASTSSPSAFAALIYSLPSGGHVGKLMLAVAPSSATVPLSKLQVCPLASTIFKPAQGGAMADAPKFDCTKNVTAQPSSSGSAYEFDVSSLVGGGSLAVAVVPTSPTDRVVLTAPDGNSLAVEVAPPTARASDRSAQVPAGGHSLSNAAPAAPTEVAPSITVVAAPSGSARPARNAAVEYVPTLAAGVGHTRGAALLLLLVGVAVIAGGWFMIGRVAVSRALSPATAAEGEVQG